MKYERNGYPKLIVDLNKLRNNINQIKKRCDELDIASRCKAAAGSVGKFVLHSPTVSLT